jgi:radical SAM protein with 4Fe4S-binding SPASM domain
MRENHNWLRRNEKSYERAIGALELITNSPRLSHDVVTCVHKRNIEELTDIKHFLISKNVKNWRIFTIAPIERAMAKEQLQLSSQDFTQLMDFIAETRKRKEINMYFSCEAYMGDYERRVRDSFFFCRAGVNIGSVLIDGSISACPNINRSFVQGNIYTDDFWDVWQNRFQIMRNRDWCKTGVCADCKVFRYCKGGAMHLWNKPGNGNTGCPYRKIEKKS